MRITVFTPAYNRGYIIGELYESLKKQSFRDFEWIVIDDGSTDNTEELFRQFTDSEFPVIYKKVSNGGKHRAINLGVQMARGELFYIVDSDDHLPSNALEIIHRMEMSIPVEDKQYFGGVCGMKGREDGTAIGNSFVGLYLDITSLERPKYNISGDKAEVFYVELLRKYPFPEFEGENFVTECVVWDRIAADGYKLRFFNEVVMICDYLPDGLTAQGEALLLRNPKGYGLYLYQCGQNGKLFGFWKWNTYLKYYFNLRDQYSFGQIAKNLCMNPVVLWIRLFGLRLFYKLYDR